MCANLENLWLFRAFVASGLRRIFATSRSLALTRGKFGTACAKAQSDPSRASAPNREEKKVGRRKTEVKNRVQNTENRYEARTFGA